MSPVALTSPPPGSATGLNFFPLPEISSVLSGICVRPALVGPARNRPGVAGIDAAAMAGRSPARFRRVPMARKFLTLLMITGGIALAGCNTIEGMGRDIKSAGDEVADATD